MNRIFKFESYDYWKEQILKVLDIIDTKESTDIYLSKTNPVDPDIVINIGNDPHPTLDDNDIIVTTPDSNKYLFEALEDGTFVLRKEITIVTKKYTIILNNFIDCNGDNNSRSSIKKEYYIFKYLIKEFIENTLKEEK